jgi:hypothetical protein
MSASGSGARRRPPHPAVVDLHVKHTASVTLLPTHAIATLSVSPDDTQALLRLEWQETPDREPVFESMGIPIAALDAFALGVRALVAELRKHGGLR